MEWIQSLIASYGDWVLGIGTVLEGETVLLIAGWAAHQGLLELPWVLLVAALGGFTGDQIFFWLGRRHGPALIQRFPKLRGKVDQVHDLVERYHAGVIIGVRFAYGLRIAGPVIIGSSGLSPLRFAFFNAIGAALWASLIGGAGWAFGHAMEALIGRVWHAQLGVLLIGGGAVLLWLLHRWLRPRA